MLYGPSHLVVVAVAAAAAVVFVVAASGVIFCLALYLLHTPFLSVFLAILYNFLVNSRYLYLFFSSAGCWIFYEPPPQTHWHSSRMHAHTHTLATTTSTVMSFFFTFEFFSLRKLPLTDRLCCARFVHALPIGRVDVDWITLGIRFCFLPPPRSLPLPTMAYLLALTELCYGP